MWVTNICWRGQAVNNEINRTAGLVFLLTALFISLTYARAETPLLERPITLTLYQDRMDIALTKISEQGGFTFSYSPSIVDVSRLVSATFAGNSVREVLDQLFQGAVQYKVRGNYIILTRAVASSSDSRVYSGYVVDETTGQRLKNVSVYDPVSLSSAVTDDYGYFQIKLDKPTAEDVQLAIKKRNYTDTLISVSPGRANLLKIPITLNQERIGILADSISEKIQRFWETKILAPQSVNVTNIRDTLYRTTQFSLLPFIGTNHRLSANVINDYSFNIFGGYALGVKKLEIGGIFNLDRGDVTGLQLAGMFNAVAGQNSGLQVAGIGNLNLDSAKGAQFAGLINLSWNSTRQFSAAGLLNVTYRDSKGVHLAGLGNVTIGDQDGIHAAGLFNMTTKTNSQAQLSGLLNFSVRGITGVQAAGLINYAGKEMKGVQLSGLLNVVPGRAEGLQMSGLINYATRIKGVQVGLINISDSIRGAPLGLISIVRKGYHQLEVSADEIFYTNLAFRTGIRQFYNILTVGAKPSSLQDDETWWTFGYGFGTSPKVNRWLNLNFDITANQIGKGEKFENMNLLNKIHAGVEFRPLKKLGIYVGATFNAYYTENSNPLQFSDLFTDARYTPDIVYEKTYSNDINVKMWWGGKVGLRFF